MTGEHIPPPESAAPPPDWRRVHAFGLPDGSVRAVLAVGVFGAIWALLVSRPDQEVPDHLRNLLFIIMGHYFATRRRAAEAPAIGPGPLFLPRGTIRWILVGGFVCVGAILFRRGHFRDPLASSAVVTLVLVAGFLLGVVVARWNEWRRAKGHPAPRWIEDVRAAAALVAAIVLISLIWNEPWSGGVRLGSYRLEHVMSAVVGFYFGTRS
jgi:hypothetical protein